MTKEELKNIGAPSAAEKKPLTERQKKRNTVFLQLGGALLLLLFACVIVPVSLIGIKYFCVVKLGRAEDSMQFILNVTMILSILLSWWFSRQVCKIIVKRHLKDKITAEAVEMYK